MAHFLINFFLMLIALLLIVIGVQFIRGKWLRLLAGNLFGEIPKSKTVKSGRVVGSLCLIGAVLAIMVIANLAGYVSDTLIWGLIIALVILTIGYIGYQYYCWAKGN